MRVCMCAWRGGAQGEAGLCCMWAPAAAHAARVGHAVWAGACGQLGQVAVAMVPRRCSAASFGLPEASHVNTHLADMQQAHP